MLLSTENACFLKKIQFFFNPYLGDLEQSAWRADPRSLSLVGEKYGDAGTGSGMTNAKEKKATPAWWLG